MRAHDTFVSLLVLSLLITVLGFQQTSRICKGSIGAKCSPALNDLGKLDESAVLEQLRHI